MTGGRDIQVGSAAGQLASLDLVPWESLQAGDTVRIFHRTQPYAGKFMVSARGTADKPVRICGVKSAAGERPVITGVNATTRPQLAGVYGAQNSYTVQFNETRGVIFVGNQVAQPFTSFPSYIQIDGLKITGAHPNYSFKDGWGVTQKYIEFGACVWMQRGQNIVIADNEITDCSQGIYSRSTEDGDFAITKNIRLAGNTFTNNGITNNQSLHATYMASENIIYEFNVYGPLRSGAAGNSIKDRSVGTIVRYNRIEDGARALDLVDAQDFPIFAVPNPAYRTTFVYGNQIIKDGRKGSTIHYGGDISGGEHNFRKGTLYFFHNTVRITGGGYAAMFQLSTTEEKAEIHNNVFIWDADIAEKNMRSNTDVPAGYTAGGILNFGVNWATQGWQDSDIYHIIPGRLDGTGNIISTATTPVDANNFAPLAGSIVLDKAAAMPAILNAYPVQYQFVGGKWVPRATKGAAADLGSVER
jgi:hypothetical protein